MRLEEIYQKISVRKKETKKVPRLDQEIHTKQVVRKYERQIYQKVGGECKRTYQQTDQKEVKQFWSEIREREVHNERPNG